MTGMFRVWGFGVSAWFVACTTFGQATSGMCCGGGGGGVGKTMQILMQSIGCRAPEA